MNPNIELAHSVRFGGTDSTHSSGVGPSSSRYLIVPLLATLIAPPVAISENQNLEQLWLSSYKKPNFVASTYSGSTFGSKSSNLIRDDELLQIAAAFVSRQTGLGDQIEELLLAHFDEIV